MSIGKVPGGAGVVLFLGTVVLGGFWPAERASATSITWSGANGAVNLNWSNTNNWNPAGSASGDTVVFNNTGGTSGATITSIVDQNFTISSLAFTNSGTTANQNLTIGSTASPTTLTVNGAGGAAFGTTAGTVSGTVSLSGTGAFVVSNGSANFYVGPGNTFSTSGVTNTVNMSGLSSFTFSGSNFNVGVLSGISGRSDLGVVQLASTSSITATGQIDVGDSGGQNAVTGNSTLDLSTGSNTIDTNTFYVGRSKANGTVVFAGTAATAPVVTIRGSTGGNSRVTTFTLGDHSASASENPGGIVNFSSGQVNAMIGTLTIGANDDIGTLGGSGSGVFIMGPNPSSLVDMNTVNVAAVAGVTSGTLQVEGGTFAFGTLTTSNGSAATVLFQGGTICSNTASSTESPHFHLGVSSGTGTVTFGQAAGYTYTGSLTFNGSATLDGSTTLQVNVPTTINGSIVNGLAGAATLTKAGTASLVLSGSASSYSGGTTVQNGTLQLGNASALGSSSGTLGVNGGALRSPRQQSHRRRGHAGRRKHHQ